MDTGRNRINQPPPPPRRMRVSDLPGRSTIDTLTAECADGMLFSVLRVVHHPDNQRGGYPQLLLVSLEHGKPLLDAEVETSYPDGEDGLAQAIADMVRAAKRARR